MFRPSLSEAEAIAGSYDKIPVSLEIYADMKTPIGILKSLERRRDCFLLESVEGGEKWARYSFIGCDPKMTVSSRGGRAEITCRDGSVTTEEKPLEALRRVLKVSVPSFDYLPRFTGGAVGYFGYDFVRNFEELPDENPDDGNFPDCCLMVVDRLIVYDNIKQKIMLIACMDTKGDVKQNYEEACAALNKMYETVSQAGAAEAAEKPKASIPQWKSNFTKAGYEEIVEKAKQHIRDGDIFQVVLSQRFEAQIKGSLLDTYRVLRVTNPSPYMYYLKTGDIEIAGASPETLLRLEKGRLETCPIAGSRPRGKTAEEDAALESELLADEKELSEHNMLVDLGRNDLGRVSKFGSVEVKEYQKVVRYSHIMHITTLVTSQLDEKLDALDALGSVLPAGTLSGAPKVMAMKLIDKYENRRRGPYGGAVGYIGFDGNMDVCITIRTIVKNGDTAYVQAGAGIVADSVPEKEYEESRNKARAVLLAAERAGEIL